MCRTLQHSVRHIQTHSENVVRIYFSRHRLLFPKKFQKTTAFSVYFELVILILEDLDGMILNFSRLDSVVSRSDHFETVYSRSISRYVPE